MNTQRFFFFLSFVAIFFNSYISRAQNTIITNDETYSGHNSAMLDVQSTEKGVLVPRLTTGQMNAISNAAQGLLIFNESENGFFFYDGNQWISLSADSISWTRNGDHIYYNNGNVGIGTSNPTRKLEIGAEATASDTIPLFEIKNKEGLPVFRVFPNGVEVIVDEQVKASNNLGGFAVSGRSANKGESEYLLVTPDSVRVYINDSSQRAGNNLGGFAVSGRSSNKTNSYDLMRITNDSTRFYIESDPYGKAGNNLGGFAVSGRSANKELINTFFNISGDDSAQVIDPSEPRVVWYPAKEAFLVGRVLIESPDSVGQNSLATGYESKAIGNWSQALGYQSKSIGDYSTAIGKNTHAHGLNSFAFGTNALVSSNDAFAFGSGSIASGPGSFSFGSEGRDTLGNLTGINTSASGPQSFAMGLGCESTNLASFALGANSTSNGQFAFAIGRGSVANGRHSMAMFSATATGDYSFASGKLSESVGHGSICIGYPYVEIVPGVPPTHEVHPTVTNGISSMAIGAGVETHGHYSMALGIRAIAQAETSMAIGFNVEADGIGSFAMGNSAKNDGHLGSFVYGDKSSILPVVNDADNQFTIRASGGTKIYTTPTMSMGVQLPAGGGAWSSISDETKKENFQNVNKEEILKKLEDINIREWNYKSQKADIRHIGITAQDFNAKFGYGEYSDAINMLDIDGVNMIAIQGLIERNKNLQRKVDDLEKQMNALKEEMKKIANQK